LYFGRRTSEIKHKNAETAAERFSFVSVLFQFCFSRADTVTRRMFEICSLWYEFVRRDEQKRNGCKISDATEVEKTLSAIGAGSSSGRRPGDAGVPNGTDGEYPTRDESSESDDAATILESPPPPQGDLVQASEVVAVPVPLPRRRRGVLSMVVPPEELKPVAVFPPPKNPSEVSPRSADVAEVHGSETGTSNGWRGRRAV